MFQYWDCLSLKNARDIPYVNILTMEFDYNAPSSFVWVCGQWSFLSLPAGWSGTCYLARLIPNVFLYSNLSSLFTGFVHHCVVKQNCIPGRGFFLTWALPWWGVVKEGHDVNANVNVCLEIFSVLGKEAKYMRMILLQHQTGLAERKNP